MGKDEQLKKILVTLQSSVKVWDSEKCPPIKEHIERMKALEPVEETDPEPEPAPETGHIEEDNGEETSGGETVTEDPPVDSASRYILEPILFFVIARQFL